MLQVMASWVCNALPESVLSFRIVSFVVLTTLVMEYVKSYARAIHRNHLSARVDVTYAVLLLVSTLALTSGLGIVGYALAVTLSPLVAALLMGIKLRILTLKWGKLGVGYNGFWSYGLFTTAGALLAQLFFSVDVFMIGHYAGEKATAVAVYRVALLIPMATSVLPVSVAATDFVKNSAIKHDVSALRAYMRNYWKTFGGFHSLHWDAFGVGTLVAEGVWAGICGRGDGHAHLSDWKLRRSPPSRSVRSFVVGCRSCRLEYLCQCCCVRVDGGAMHDCHSALGN